MKKLSFSFLFLFITAVLFAGSAMDFQSLVSKADKAYTDGHFGEAIASYEKVLQAGFESSSLYYNLGNSYYKDNQYPAAILNYEKARKLDPGNEDIDFNLKVVNSKIADKIDVIPPFFLKRWLTSVIELTSMDGWAKACIAAFILALFGLGLYFLAGTLILRKTGFWLGVFMLFLSLISGYFAWSEYSNGQHKKEGILFTPTVTVKSSPDENSTDLFVIHEGTKAIILDNVGAWYEIRIANGSVGWVPATSIREI